MPSDSSNNTTTPPAILFGPSGNMVVNALGANQVTETIEQLLNTIIFECDLSENFVKLVRSSDATENIADDDEVIAKHPDFGNVGPNENDASGVDLTQFKNLVYNALGNTIIKVVDSTDVNTDEIITENSYNSVFTVDSTAANSTPSSVETFGEQMVKGYINAMLERNNNSTYSAIVLDASNAEALIRDTTNADTYTNAETNDPYNIDKLATDALHQAADGATWSDWNEAFKDLLRHGNDASENALILENYDGSQADPLFQNTRFYFKLFVKVFWNANNHNSNGPGTARKPHHNIGVNTADLDVTLTKADFNSTVLGNMGITLYTGPTTEASADNDVISHSFGSVLVKFNVDSAGLTSPSAD